MGAIRVQLFWKQMSDADRVEKISLKFVKETLVNVIHRSQHFLNGDGLRNQSCCICMETPKLSSTGVWCFSFHDQNQQD